MKLAPFDEGGPASVGYGLVKHFLNVPDLEVTLIVGNSASKEQIVNIFGDRFEDIIRVPLERSTYTYVYGTLCKMKKVWQALKFVDIVHVNLLHSLRNFYLPYFALTQKKPISCTIHSAGGPYLHSLFYGEKARALKVLAYNILTDLHQPLWSRIVVNSRFVKTVVSRTLDEKKICLIPNGVDYGGIKEAKRINLDGEVKLLFVGKLKPVKGLDILLEALAILEEDTKKKTKMYIAGSGAYKKEYQLLAKSLKVDGRVQFLGHLPLDKCYSLYKSCDMLVMPSRFESFPITLLEALGSGIPIIATKVGGIPEIVKNNRNGFLVDLNPFEFAKKIDFLTNHPEVCEQFSRNNLIDAKKYLWQKVAQQYLDLYETMV